jgi:hypothetical protein
MPDGMKQVGLVSRPNLPDDRRPDGAMGVSAGGIPPTSENRAALEKTLAARFSTPRTLNCSCWPSVVRRMASGTGMLRKTPCVCQTVTEKSLPIRSRRCPTFFDNWEALIHADDVDRHRDAMAAHLKGDRDYHSAEFRVRRKVGAWSWMYVRGWYMRGADGRVRRVAGAASDITERKAVEYARVDAEKRA